LLDITRYYTNVSSVMWKAVFVHILSGVSAKNCAMFRRS